MASSMSCKTLQRLQLHRAIGVTRLSYPKQSRKQRHRSAIGVRFALSSYGDSGTTSQKIDRNFPKFLRVAQVIANDLGQFRFTGRKTEPYPTEIRVDVNAFFIQEKFAIQAEMEREMSIVFWVATIVMVMLALGFLTMPLIREKRRLEPAGIAVLLPLFAASLYWSVGLPQAATANVPADIPKQGQPKTLLSSPTPVGSVASMVDDLAKRLRRNPDDGKGWLLLARSYSHLKRTAEARNAYARAASLGERDEKLSTTLGSAESRTSE